MISSVWGLGFMGEGLGCFVMRSSKSPPEQNAGGVRSGPYVQGFGCSVWGLVFGVLGERSGVWGSGLRVHDSGFSIAGSS